MRRVDLRRRDGSLLDRGLGVFFPKPASFTGEDVVEFHTHGGRAVVAAVLTELQSMPGFRQAEAGEFTRRAYVNGKMSLVEAEALSDLIGAETDAQRRFALLNADGHHARQYKRWKDDLLDIRAYVEADIDFSDQDDVGDAVSAQVAVRISHLRAEIERSLCAYRSSEIIRDGFRVVIAGPPNAGKSTLLNALVKREIAIVSDEPGTTRDIVEATLDLDGYKVIIADTAGIRTDPGHIEAIGISRALERMADADLVLHLNDGFTVEPEIAGLHDANCLKIRSKADLLEIPSTEIAVSASTGQGLTELLELIGERVRNAAGATTDLMPFQLRHVRHLRGAVAALTRAEEAGSIEIVAEELRQAATELASILGEGDVEGILGRIFSTFCIVKCFTLNTIRGVNDSRETTRRRFT